LIKVYLTILFSLFSPILTGNPRSFDTIWSVPGKNSAGKVRKELHRSEHFHEFGKQHHQDEHKATHTA
jgi:hypothetical protein